MALNQANPILLSVYYGHNATVGLMIGGKTVLVLSEERLNRLKNSTGFPEKALAYAIQHYLDGDASKIDRVIINDERLLGFNYLEKRGWGPLTYSDYFHRTKKPNATPTLRGWLKHKFKKPAFPPSVPLPTSSQLTEAKTKLASKIGVSADKITFLDHHTSHAWSAISFVSSEEGKRLIFTLDGEGDGLCATVSIFENGKLTRLSETDRHLSLGYIYREVTGFLGMKPDEHEFKVMGMAPYAWEKEANRLAALFAPLLQIDTSGQFVSQYNLLDIDAYLRVNLAYERFDYVSGGLQIFTEKIICDWITAWIKKTGIADISLGGGVFMNVKASLKVAELPEVKSLFVVPSAADESLVIGGMVYAQREIYHQPIQPISDLYLGRDFSDEAIETYFKTANVASRYEIKKLNEDDMAVEVGKLLADNKIVARCVGREEWGARALGNRSIMANPRNFDNLRVLNRKVKSRDFWMPFTPSILKERLADYIENPKKIFAPYMCLTFHSTALAKRDIPAALHPSDYTARPQLVDKTWNPGYHKIISAFERHTGIGAVLNTSFNLHGEPNVGGPEDAIHTLDHSGLNYLVLGSFLVKKIASED
jgi:carbamoyltransferase